MSLIGLDLGTSRCKGALYSEDGRELAFASREGLRTTGPAGRSELDAREVVAMVNSIVEELSAIEPPSAIAASTFGGAACLLDEQGAPLTPLISTTDPRAEALIERWQQELGPGRLRELTGLHPHCSYALGKWAWRREMLPEAVRATRYVATSAELVLAGLGASPACDLATASTTMALDATSGAWSEELLQLAKLPPEWLPPLVESGALVGQTPTGCLLVAVRHDQQVCALGAGVSGEGQAALSLGTVECATAVFEQSSALAGFALAKYPLLFHAWDRLRAVLGYHYCGSDLWAWAEHCLRLDALEEAMPLACKRALELPESALALPHFAGSGLPDMEPAARGLLAGLSLTDEPTDLLAALVRGQTLEIGRCLADWARAGLQVNELVAFGGGARWPELLQLKADLLEIPVRKANRPEPGCFGAFLLALKALRGAEAVKALLEVENQPAAVACYYPRAEYAALASVLKQRYTALTKASQQFLKESS